MIKFCKLIDIIPHLFSGSMEDMCTVSVYLDPLYFFCVNITADMTSLIDHKACFPPSCGLMCKYCTKKAGSYYQIIIFLHVRHLLLVIIKRIKSSASLRSSTPNNCSAVYQIKKAVTLFLRYCYYNKFIRKWIVFLFYYFPATLSNTSVISLDGAFVARLKIMIITRLTAKPTARE